MRNLPAALQDKLDGGVTTLCLCWKLTPRGRPPLGFTDHDRDVSLDGLVFRAASGFTRSEAQAALGLAPAATEISGALSADDLKEEDLAAGVYDDARMEVWLVDWTDVSLRHLLFTGSIGRVTRGEKYFEAEIRNLAHYLSQPQGRVFSHGCDARVGDERCRADLGDPRFRGTGTVAEVMSPRSLAASGLSGFAPGWFSGGRLSWTGGANAGDDYFVSLHEEHDGGARLELERAPANPPAPGDAFTITAGCDRQFTTCRDKFANAENFRGFPHMPGNDFVISYPNKDDPGNDGGSMNL